MGKALTLYNNNKQKRLTIRLLLQRVEVSFQVRVKKIYVQKIWKSKNSYKVISSGFEESYCVNIKDSSLSSSNSNKNFLKLFLNIVRELAFRIGSGIFSQVCTPTIWIDFSANLVWRTSRVGTFAVLLLREYECKFTNGSGSKYCPILERGKRLWWDLYKNFPTSKE